VPADDIGELLFLLSSSERMEILSSLSKQGMRLSALASKRSSTVQETSRQLERLQGAGLVEKDVKGLYHLTSYCRLVLQLLPSFGFLVAHSDYLRDHDLTFLPSPLLERIGELNESELGESVGIVLDHFDKVLGESKKYIHLMADHILMNDRISGKVLEGGDVALRIIVPAKALDGLSPGGIPNESRGRFELGVLEEVRVGLALNEALAGIAFPDASGKVDFNRGFRGRSPIFQRWCEDLFDHYWRAARKFP